MPLKIALIGAGHMGRIHLEKLIDFEDVEVGGVVDVDRNTLNNISEKHQVPIFADYKDIPDGLAGVVIASSTGTHYKVAKNFLEKGVHVFIEKPITSRINQGEELVELAERQGLILQIGHLERFNPAYREAISHIKKPLFIEARRMSNFTGRSTDIDVVLDLMIHDIDLTLSIMKEDVTEIRAHGLHFASDKLDMVSAWLEFAGGCVACITASRVSVNKERNITIFEKNKQYFVDLLNGRLTGKTKKQDGSIETLEYEADKVDSVKEELSEFIYSIRGDKTPCVGGKEGLRALVIAEQIKAYIARNKA
jgi:predicted dehydrogenase